MRLSTNKQQIDKTQGTDYRKRLEFFGFLCLVFFLIILLFVIYLRQKPVSKVWINRLKNGHYQLMTGSKPFFVKGVCYNPIPLGKNYEYDWWSDPNKPWLTDGKLMQEMGINTIRLYQTHEDSKEVKRVVNDMYELYGIRTLLGHWVGFWEYPCPFYGESQFQERIKKEVLEMVQTYKDEPGILCWVLGNENNYSCLGQVQPWSTEEVDKETDPQKQRFLRYKIYYSFINELAREIHKIDPNHPVALGNGELIGLDVAAQFCPDIDLVACIIYRGKTFGNLFNSLRLTFDKPILISEFGADCYDAFLKKEDQDMQAFFLESQWKQIYANMANGKGAGNCIGGVIFEWTDEWWKHNQHDAEGWRMHDTESNWSNGSYYFDIRVEGNKNMNEEWFGIVALSEDQKDTVVKENWSFNKRIPRKAYYAIRDFWKNPSLDNKTKKTAK